MPFSLPCVNPFKCVVKSDLVDAIEVYGAHEQLYFDGSILVHVVDNLTVILPQSDAQP